MDDLASLFGQPVRQLERRHCKSVEETIEWKVVCQSSIDRQHCNRQGKSPKDSEIKETVLSVQKLFYSPYQKQSVSQIWTYT